MRGSLPLNPTVGCLVPALTILSVSSLIDARLSGISELLVHRPASSTELCSGALLDNIVWSFSYHVF